MTQPARAILVGATVGLLIGGAACAKRPSITVASAPAPAASVVEAPPSAPAPTAVAAPAPAPTPALQPAAPAPQPPPPVTARPAPVNFRPNEALRPIHFDFDEAKIRSGDARILEATARWLKQNPGHLVLVEGHCDPRGTEQYNLALGERRARATMNFLAAHGVASSRLSIVSYGEERPLCQSENEACWAQNRRATFLTKPQ